MTMINFLHVHWGITVLPSRSMDITTAFTLMQLNPGTATQDDARRAYKRLALEVHPDKNASATASEEFVLLQEAHEVVHAYLSSAPEPTVLEVGPQDVCKGVPLRRVEVEVMARCEACHGYGAPNPRNVFECIECRGVGKAGCPGCAGIGRVPKRGCACRTCHGTGRVREKRRVEVTVPVGAAAGDALAEGVVCAHRAFDGWRWRLEGRDLLIEVDVTIREAMCGISRGVETCRGPQTVTIDGPVDIWKPLVLRGHGVTGTGDAVVAFRVAGWGCPLERLRMYAPALRRVFGKDQ